MRELKFRVWDIENNKYDASVGDNLFYANKKNIGFMDIMEYACDEKRYVLEQYTGLKDVNGVEIYEGDIVDDSYINSMTKEKVLLLYYVKYNEDSFILEPFKCDEGRKIYSTWLRFRIKYLKVIGNINENK